MENQFECWMIVNGETSRYRVRSNPDSGASDYSAGADVSFYGYGSEDLGETIHVETTALMGLGMALIRAAEIAEQGH